MPTHLGFFPESRLVSSTSRWRRLGTVLAAPNRLALARMSVKSQGSHGMPGFSHPVGVKPADRLVAMESGVPRLRACPRKKGVGRLILHSPGSGDLENEILW